MIKYILLGLIIDIATQIQYSLKDQCTCGEIINQFDCMLNSKCIWNNNDHECSLRQCNQIYYQQQCITTQNCYYSNNQCQSYTTCSNLKSNSTQNCQQQSYYCGVFNKTLQECVNYTSQSCQDYTNQFNCLYDINQLCLWINNTNQQNGNCIDFQCQSIQIEQQCNYYQLYCIWDYTNNTCINTTCDLQSTSQCSAIIKYNNQQQQYLQPCYVDKTQLIAKCRDANLDDLSSTTCGINTNFAATWTTNIFINNQGHCKSCYQYIITIFVLLLLFIQL